MLMPAPELAAELKAAGEWTVVSLFAGVGGFDLALKRTGRCRLVAAVEIDPDKRAVLARHFPGITLFSDIREVTGDALIRAGFVPERGIMAGGFPCFAAGTRILTERGQVPIENVVTGDVVLTHAGRWQPVTAVMTQVADHHIRLRGHGVPDIITTSEHPFWARGYRSVGSPRTAARPNGGTRREFFDAGWTPAAKMAGQYASQVLPPVEADDHAADLWWVTGRFLADGWLTSGGRKHDRAVICCNYNEADELAERIGRVVHATRSDEPTCVKFYITRAWFVQFMQPFGRGAAYKTLTRREFSLPQDKAEALLAGWLTGDGSWSAQRKWSGGTVSRSLALSMALLAQRARGVVASVHTTARTEQCVIQGRQVRQRTSYGVVIPDRNRSALVEGNYGWKLVRTATRADGPVRVYNLTVAVDESYVADGAVVHNCTDLSVAGLRRGMGAGTRSGLWWEFARLLAELHPAWVIAENVPGLLSAVCPCPGDGSCTANGRAVRCGTWRTRPVPGLAAAGSAAVQPDGNDCGECGHLLELHDDDGRCVTCDTVCAGLPPAVPAERYFEPWVSHTVPQGACAGGCMAAHGGAMGAVLGTLGYLGYGVAYRVLDAQFFGVAQQRHRVFIVGSAGDRTGPVRVLLEPEGVRGDPAAGGPAQAGAAGVAGRGAGGERRPGDGTLASTLQASAGGGHRMDAESAAGGQVIPVPVAPTLRTHPRPGSNDNGAAVVVPVALRGRDGGTDLEAGDPGGPAFTVRAQHGHGAPMIATAPGGQPVSTTLTGREHKGPDSDATTGMIVVNALPGGPPGGHRGGYAAESGHLAGQPIPIMSENLNSRGGIREEGDPSYTLTGEGRSAVAIPLSQDALRGEGAARTPSPDAEGRVRLRDPGLNIGGDGAPAQTLTAGGPGAVGTEMAVRRLTPTETERLQGFDDDWTRWRADGTVIPDSTRYRMTGEAICVNVGAWVAARIIAVEDGDL